jgi:ABC-type Fe3+-siderophore transport system permease subunit
LLRLILVVAVGLTTAAQLYQERRRLKTIERLPGPKARDHYEATRARDERLMVAVTAALVLAAAAATIAVVVRNPTSTLG